jgi:hypothetical protein
MVNLSHPRTPNQTDLSEVIDNNLNLSICRVNVNCQIRKFKITKLKQQVMPTYSHTVILTARMSLKTTIICFKIKNPPSVELC